jgi:hypothetical protein
MGISSVNRENIWGWRRDEIKFVWREEGFVGTDEVGEEKEEGGSGADL